MLMEIDTRDDQKSSGKIGTMEKKEEKAKIVPLLKKTKSHHLKQKDVAEAGGCE